MSSQGARIKSARRLVPAATSSTTMASEGPAAPLSTEELQTLVGALQSNPSLARRIAATVNAPIANEPRYANEWATNPAATVDDAASKVSTSSLSTPFPAGWQLWHLHVRTAVPFIGFGFFDNMIMLTVGGTIESTIGVACGISTLAAAGMGQMVSDASGITLQSLIERFADRLGLPHARMTIEQQQIPFVKSFVLGSRIFGIIFGCCLGMFPLWMMPGNRVALVDQIAQALPAQRKLEFMSLVTAREYKEGEKILKYAEMSDNVFLLESGEVECVGRDAEGLPFHVCTMGPGNSFGKPQLHHPSHVDLIAKEGSVKVQMINKDDFLRVTGDTGLEVWRNTQQLEHTVYDAAQGHRIVEAVPPARRGTGKTRMFASLTDAEKCEVLAFTGLEAARAFNGSPNEGKVSFFAKLSEVQKHDALAKWHEQRFRHCLHTS